MTRILIDGVTVVADKSLPEGLVHGIVAEEKELMRNRKRKLGLVELRIIDGEEIEVLSKPRAEIKRLRRITGYLSDLDNFNKAKKSEMLDRYKHCVV